jgi:hypothetical protein
LLLRWLADEESEDGHFSFTPVEGRGRGGRKPGFDQQPIEAWTMVDACVCAHSCTGDPQWADTALRAASWFLGENDLGAVMYDPVTGGGYDGLERRGVNRNQGAESSIAFVATMVLARTVAAQATREATPFAARTARR